MTDENIACLSVKTLRDDCCNITHGTGYDCPSLSHPLPEIRYVTLVSYAITFAFGICGNSLVIYVITRFSEIRHKSVANYYIWNLAVADDLYIMSLPMFIWATYLRRWPLDGALGQLACKLAYVGRDVTKFASIFTLMALSVDRYLASYSDLGHLRTIRTGKIVCCFVWFACVVVSTPYLIYAGTIDIGHTNTTTCRLNWPSLSHPLSDPSRSMYYSAYYMRACGLCFSSYAASFYHLSGHSYGLCRAFP